MVSYKEDPLSPAVGDKEVLALGPLYCDLVTLRRSPLCLSSVREDLVAGEPGPEAAGLRGPVPGKEMLS